MAARRAVTAPVHMVKLVYETATFHRGLKIAAS